MMTVSEWKKENGNDLEAVGVVAFGFYHGIEILDIIYDIDDYIIWRYAGDCEVDKKIHRSKIYYWSNCADWFFKTSEGLKIHGSEIMRVQNF